MGNVTLAIGGREFTVACAAGEEAHIIGLGRMIDQRLARMGMTAQQGETRMLLFAALLLADEVHDARPAPPAPVSSERLDAIAARIEALAARLADPQR